MTEKIRTLKFDIGLSFEYGSEDLDILCKDYNVGLSQIHKLIEKGISAMASDFNLVETLEAFNTIRASIKQKETTTEVKKGQDEVEKPIKKETPKKENKVATAKKKSEDVAEQMQREFEDLTELEDDDDELSEE